MKMRSKTIAALLAASVLGLGAAGSAIATPWGGGHQDACEHRAGKHGGMTRMFKHLDLSEAQRDQLFEIRHNQRPAMREKMKELRQSRSALRELAAAESSDEAKVKAAAEQQSRVRAELIVMRTEAMHTMLQVLTPEQKQKLSEKRQQRFQH